MAGLYRYRWDNRCYPGYMVYRHCFDDTKCTIEDGSLAHRVALFVLESDAKEYCNHRNNLVTKNGDDRIDQ